MAAAIRTVCIGSRYRWIEHHKPKQTRYCANLDSVLVFRILWSRPTKFALELPAGLTKKWTGFFTRPKSLDTNCTPWNICRGFSTWSRSTLRFTGTSEPELGRLWCRKVAGVNPNFNFTAKLNRAFTHSPIAVVGPTSAATIRPTDEDEARAREGLDTVAGEGKLGALLIQFPISFKNTSLNREYLDRLLRQFIEYPRVVEVRHSSWENPETIASFMQKNVAFCNIDQPVLGQSLSPTQYVTQALATFG